MMGGTIPKSLVLMIQSTTIGKYSVHLTMTSINFGVALVLKNIIALGTD